MCLQTFCYCMWLQTFPLLFSRRHVRPAFPWHGWVGERHRPRHDAHHREPPPLPQLLPRALPRLPQRNGDRHALSARPGERRQPIGLFKPDLRVIIRQWDDREVLSGWRCGPCLVGLWRRAVCSAMCGVRGQHTRQWHTPATLSCYKYMT